MNLSLSKRLNEILKQYVSAPPEFSEKVVQWVDDLQRETSAADHENLREDIRDLKDDVSQIRDQLTDFKLNTSERFNALERTTVLMQSELKEQIHGLEKNTGERFSALEKTIKVNFMWAMLLITGLLFPVALPHIQAWFQR